MGSAAADLDQVYSIRLEWIPEMVSAKGAPTVLWISGASTSLMVKSKLPAEVLKLVHNPSITWVSEVSMDHCHTSPSHPFSESDSPSVGFLTGCPLVVGR